MERLSPACSLISVSHLDCSDDSVFLDEFPYLRINGTSGRWTIINGSKTQLEWNNHQSAFNSIPNDEVNTTKIVPWSSPFAPTYKQPQYLKSLCQALIYADDTVLAVAKKNIN